MNQDRIEHVKSTETPASRLSHDGLEVLSNEESAELLRNHHLGRFVFAYESWPVVMPVNYVFEQPTVVIRTDLGAKLSAAPFHAAAFEIDEVDPLGAWGWSVLAQGPAFDITSALDERSEHLRSLPVTPWPPGIRDHWLTMSAVRLTGRCFGRVSELEQLSAASRSESYEER